MEPIKTRWLVSVMLIIDGLANLIIWNPFDDYIVHFIEGCDHHSMSIRRRGKALCSINSVRFSLLKSGENNLCDMRRGTHRNMSEKRVFDA